MSGFAQTIYLQCQHARLATDLLCEQQKWGISNWGLSDLAIQSKTRRDYIEALRAADSNDFSVLIEFMAI